MENFIIEDNVIEIDPIRSDWALVCSDGYATDILRSFKIRNNVIRAFNGLQGNAGGIGVYVADATSFQVSANRVESGLRSAFFGSVPGFDNTDLVGNPLSTI